MTLDQLKKEIADARAAYQAVANTAPADQTRALSQRVKALQAEFAAAITEGAKSCPKCGKHPHGIEHQVPKGVEYEVGCLGCKGADGQPIRVRGGVLPRHTVELWNERA